MACSSGCDPEILQTPSYIYDIYLDDSAIASRSSAVVDLFTPLEHFTFTYRSALSSTRLSYIQLVNTTATETADQYVLPSFPPPSVVSPSQRVGTLQPPSPHLPPMRKIRLYDPPRVEYVDSSSTQVIRAVVSSNAALDQIIQYLESIGETRYEYRTHSGTTHLTVYPKTFVFENGQAVQSFQPSYTVFNYLANLPQADVPSIEYSSGVVFLQELYTPLLPPET